MVVTCENCSTRFNLSQGLLKPTGSRVRCSQCRHVFTVYPEASEAAPPFMSEDDQPAAENDRAYLEFTPEVPDEAGQAPIGNGYYEGGEEAAENHLSESKLPDSERLPALEEAGTPAEADDTQDSDANRWNDDFALKLSEIEELDSSADYRQQGSRDAFTDSVAPVKGPPPAADETSTIESFKNEFWSDPEDGEPDDAKHGPLETNALKTSKGLQIVKRPRVRPGFIVLLILCVLVGGTYWGLYFAAQKGIEFPVLKDLNLPFLSHLLPPSYNDQGHHKIVTLDINSQFIDNVTAGRLFVITGKVRNDYPEPRGLIRAEGHLFTKGAKPAKTESVFCGNIISDLDLSRMEIADIHRQLGNRFGGGQKANLKILPAQSIPFMIVFDQLPEDLEEFTIEVVGSIPIAM